MSNFVDGWITEEISDKFNNGKELSGDEALAYLCAEFSNATKNNYDAEQLFERVSGGFSITIKRK